MQNILEGTDGAARQTEARASAFDVAALAGLVLLSLAACGWRLACVRLGPDPDTDAYGHYVIARQLLETPGNHSIHWVWLPLYHAWLALLVALGAAMDQVRQLNAIGAALPPLLLLWALRRRPSSTAVDAAVPVVATVLAGLSPLLMELGTTAQMEVFFCTLLVLSAGLLARGRHAAAAAALCALVLTRYEGWAVAATVAAVTYADARSARRPLGAARWACVLLPGLVILTWAGLRRLEGEPWFGFILDNQAFAEAALEQRPDSHGRLGALGRYLLSVPGRTFGACAPLALLGLPRALRREGVWLVAPGLALLAFLTLSSLTRSQLGLERHFLAVVPFFATWVAHGLARAAELLASLGRSPRAAPLALLGLLGAVLADSLPRLDATLSGWRRATRDALAEARAAAAFLREAPPDGAFIADEASIEVLSELPRERFVRAPLGRALAARLPELARRGPVFIAGRSGRVARFAREVEGKARLQLQVRHGTLFGPPEAFAVVQALPSGWPPAAAPHDG